MVTHPDTVFATSVVTRDLAARRADRFGPHFARVDAGTSTRAPSLAAFPSARHVVARLRAALAGPLALRHPASPGRRPAAPIT